MPGHRPATRRQWRSVHHHNDAHCIRYAKTSLFNSAVRASCKKLCSPAPPRIRLEPARQEVRAGDSADVNCVAESGDPPIDTSWEKEGSEGGAMPASVTVSGGLMRFTAIAVSDAGRYVCTARNAAGTARATAEVIVHGELRF